ncbi:MAG: hypothetical protein FIA96_08105, partial [Betaproteobacteria bacterium]|nr:hypothetical protein [Betaproteobacteria bacterium]
MAAGAAGQRVPHRRGFKYSQLGYSPSHAGEPPPGILLTAAIAAIATELGNTARRFDIDLLPSGDSTNAVLLARADAGAPSGTVVIATEQTAGRGRRGRSWVASPGDSLSFSLRWRFAPGTAPAGLSLAVGVAVAR